MEPTHKKKALYGFRVGRPFRFLSFALSSTFQWVLSISVPYLPDLPTSRPSVLCPAKTTASPPQFSSRCTRSPIPCMHHFVRGPLGSPVDSVPRLPTPGRCIPVYRSRFPAARSWRFSQVPRLPLKCVHAPLADSGGVPAACHNATRTLAFQRIQPVSFPHPRMGYPPCPYGPRPYNFRSSITRSIHLLHLAPHIASRDMHARSLQIRRFTSSGGIHTACRTHPLGNINQIHRVLSDPRVLRLIRLEIAVSKIIPDNSGRFTGPLSSKHWPRICTIPA